jgi:hypothetical protein
MSNVPSDPYSEEAWKKIVDRSSGLRSIFLPTETYSLFVYSGQSIVAKPADNVPFGERTLPGFTVRGLARMPNFSIFLLLSGRLSVSRELHTVSFPVRWSARHTRSNGDIVFFYVPEKIFIRMPASDQSDAVDRLPSATSAGEQVMVPIDRVLSYPASTLARFTRAKALRGNKNYPVSPTNGFSGVYKSTFPKVIEIDILDAHFPAVGPAYLDGQRKLQTRYENRVSVSTPGFRGLSKGQLPVNPFSYTLVRTDDMPSSDQLTFPAPSGLVKTDYYGASAYTFFTPPPLPGHNSSVKNKAISNLIKKAEEDIAANLAQDFAQFGQLTRLIAGNATKIYNAVRAVKRGDVTTALQSLGADTRTRVHHNSKGTSKAKSTADLLLEIQYGWKPLLSDIDGMMRLLAQSMLKKPKIVTVRSGSNKTIKREVRTSFFPGKEDIVLDVEEFYSCRVGVRYTYRSELVSYLQQTGFTNPINLAWEILPGSFIADWFIPIGPYLETLSAWQSKVFCGGFITQFSRGQVSCGFELTNESGGYVRTVKGGYKRTSVEVVREPLGDFPRLALPKPKNPVSAEHAINAIALLTSALKR